LMEGEAGEELQEGVNLGRKNPVDVFLEARPLNLWGRFPDWRVRRGRRGDQPVKLPDTLEGGGFVAQHDVVGSLHQRLKVGEELRGVGGGESKDLLGIALL